METQDVEMTGETDAMEPSSRTGHVASQHVSSQQHVHHSLPPEQPVVPAIPAPPRTRLKITHDKYMLLRSLIVLHLAAVERETGKGVDRDELIDWYLEQKENEIQDVKEIEYEKELITKTISESSFVIAAWRVLL